MAAAQASLGGPILYMTDVDHNVLSLWSQYQQRRNRLYAGKSHSFITSSSTASGKWTVLSSGLALGRHDCLRFSSRTATMLRIFTLRIGLLIADSVIRLNGQIKFLGEHPYIGAGLRCCPEVHKGK